jgi:hypothetical protein
MHDHNLWRIISSFCAAIGGTFLTPNGSVPGQTVHIRGSTSPTLSGLFFWLTTTKPADHYGCMGPDLKIDAKSVLQDTLTRKD